MASANNTFKTREDMKRARELEEARKAGLAPAEIDQETGQEINPHIPNYMTSAPWYLNQDKPSLQHQKDWRLTESKEEKWYSRGARGKANVKFKKGACENCGATTHTVKDCLERPRKKAAKFTNRDLARDDVVDAIEFSGYAHKRDQWKGYTADDYVEVVERHEKVNAARQELLRKEAAAAHDAEDAEAEEAAAAAAAEGACDEDKLGEEEQAEFTKVNKAVRTTGGGSTGSVRNLRIREDTAKYLLNLDPASAHYDPKSRSMRADPTPDKGAHEKTFAGDNAVRETGEYEYWRQLTQHTVLAGERGGATHVQAAPTQALMAHADFKEKKAKIASKSRKAVLDKYGNAAPDKPDEELLLPASEAYVEYDREGKVIKGVEVVARSRYDEDVHPQNHTSVWGSFWAGGRWGYACCKSHMRNAMCLGDKVQRVAADNVAVMAANAERKKAEQARAAEEAAQRPSTSHKQGSDAEGLWGGEGGAEQKLDEVKVQEALAKLRSGQADAVGGGYNGLAGDNVAVTAEDMEAYRRHRSRGDDPMANMKAGAVAGGYDMV